MRPKHMSQLVNYRFRRTLLATIVATVALAAHSMTVLALALLTPVLMGCLVADIAARLLGRGPGAADPVAGALRPWLRVALALTALGASWAAYPEAWVRALG